MCGSVKDNIGLRTPSMYSIPCECGTKYIDQTVFTVFDRYVENQRHLRLGQSLKSAVAEHALKISHT